MTVAAAHIELDIAALSHNVQRVREYAPTSKLMAVIKANAYGHGLLNLAPVLAKDVDAFAVARIEEALCLRSAGLNQKILLLQGFHNLEELQLLVQYQLDAVVHSETQVQILEQARLETPLSVWLKVDTGMHRLGFEPEQVAAITSRLKVCQAVKAPLVFMTHFASADAEHDDKTLQQLRLFNAVVKDESAIRTSANSAAIIAWPETRQSWVRPGLMLYGVSPFRSKNAAQLSLRPVMSLYSRIIAIKKVKKGQAVGYGGSWQADKDTLIGVVSIGYGDGYPRHTKSGTPVLVRNQRVPLVGRVSMDMLTIDISECAHVSVGEPVTLWGKGLPIEEVAVCANTIPYTLLCAITRRVPVFTNDH